MHISVYPTIKIKNNCIIVIMLTYSSVVDSSRRSISETSENDTLLNTPAQSNNTQQRSDTVNMTFFVGLSRSPIPPSIPIPSQGTSKRPATTQIAKISKKRRESESVVSDKDIAKTLCGYYIGNLCKTYM